MCWAAFEKYHASISWDPSFEFIGPKTKGEHEFEENNAEWVQSWRETQMQGKDKAERHFKILMGTLGVLLVISLIVMTVLLTTTTIPVIGR